MSNDQPRTYKAGRYYRPREGSSSSTASRHGRDGSSSTGRPNFGQMSGGGTLKWVERTSTMGNLQERDISLPNRKEISSDMTDLLANQNSAQAIQDIAEQLESDPSNEHVKAIDSHDGHASEFAYKSRLSSEETQLEPSSQEKASANEKMVNCDRKTASLPFDICPERTGNHIKLKAPLHVKNREKRNEIKRVVEGRSIRTLRCGMVLLKSYISFNDQVSIVKKCRELGLGPGGFYQPGYREGAKLHLKMMCLGRHWEPAISGYVDQRPIDGAKPPMIPAEFCQLVKVAIQDSHAHLQQPSNARNGEDIIPSMSPDICVVNFYTKSGQLGLHQDKDESYESLHSGLPVVSFSIGDAAEFLYCDQRDIVKADKVILESGDVLIFGGKSRNIFHGVTAIHSGTAHSSLLEESNLLPGRLNLTFRQF